jgi:hypothetical protein
MSRKLSVSTDAERTAWLQTAKDFKAGKFLKATGSMKESIAIGVSFYAADPEFRKLFRLPPLRKEGLEDTCRETLKKLITGE